jgi:hypothetical protein
VREVINECRWIYLIEIAEPEDNCLRLVVQEAKAGGPLEDIEVSPGKVISSTRAIESDTSCRAFELVWSSYVAYSVRNESFCAFDREEIWEGRLFCLYSKSLFLDFVARATFASNDYPGPFRHWGVNCLNHIVDVVSTVEPQVRAISHLETPTRSNQVRVTNRCV